MTFLWFAGWTTQAAAQSDIDAIRELVAAQLQGVQVGAGYAAIVDFAVSRDISAATYYPDEVEGVHDPKLTSIKLPFSFTFGAEGDSKRPFLQGHFAYQTLDADFELLADELIRSEWKTYGGSVSGGVEIALSDSMKLLPVVSLGYGRITQRSRRGPAGALCSSPTVGSVTQPAANTIKKVARINRMSHGRDWPRCDLRHRRISQHLI